MTNESHPFSDEIHIEQIEIFTRYRSAGTRAQRSAAINASRISFWPYQQTRDMADEIEQTVNYSAVAEETKTFRARAIGEPDRNLGRSARSALAENFSDSESDGRSAEVRVYRTRNTSLRR